MRSDSVKTGTQQAPHRSLFNALGYTEEERKRPMIGIVSSYNEIVPGHMNLDKISGDCRMRRVCNGSYRHEIFFGNQGFDCRQHGVHGFGSRF